MLHLLAAGYGTVSDIELVWVIIALVGAIFSAFNLKNAIDDFRALHLLDRANGRGLIARNTFKSEAARLATQSIFLLAGLLIMTIPDSPDTPGRPWNVILIGAVVRWGFVTASILVSLQGYWSYQVRRELTGRAQAQQDLDVAVSTQTVIAEPGKAVVVVTEEDKDKTPHDPISLPPSEQSHKEDHAT